MDAIVVGNITLDILCYPVDNVPRHDSLSFDQVYVGPGGCGSNVAIGLSALGVNTGLVGWVGDDESAKLLRNFWDIYHLDQRYIKQKSSTQTGVSVGLIDTDYEPRFIHTSGANMQLTPQDIDVGNFLMNGVRWLHVAGYFVLPGLLDENFAFVMQQTREAGIKTSLDVVNSPRMDNVTPLWSCISTVDYFLCNKFEVYRITGESDPHQASLKLRNRGCGSVIIKLGAEGCFINGDGFCGHIPAPTAKSIDTTGAGDAFAAGLIKSLLEGIEIQEAAKRANEAGAKITEKFGATTAWTGG